MYQASEDHGSTSYMYNRYMTQCFDNNLLILIVTEFWFLPFDSPFQKLQNYIFSELKNHWSLETCLDTLVLDRDFIHFCPLFSPFSITKQHFESKPMSYSESALKTESIHVRFKDFWEKKFSYEKTTLYSPSGCMKKWFPSKWHFCRLVFCDFTFFWN